MSFITLLFGVGIDLIIYKIFGFEITVIYSLACIANVIYWSKK